MIDYALSTTCVLGPINFFRLFTTIRREGVPANGNATQACKCSPSQREDMRQPPPQKSPGVSMMHIADKQNMCYCAASQTATTPARAGLFVP